MTELLTGKTKRTVVEKGRAIRTHLKAGKTRAEIMEAEGFTEKEFRYALLRLGRFPKSNMEAFASFLVDSHIALQQLAEDAERVRAAGDHKSLSAFYRVAHDIRTGTMDLAMKLGLLQRAAEKMELGVTQGFVVSFGDEGTIPVWPDVEKGSQS